MRLILPESMDAPTIPDSFLHRMHDIDPGLVIYWNRFRNRFVIDRCPHKPAHTAGAHCARVNVMIVDDGEGGYMGPCDRVLDKLKSMDSWTNFGGNGAEDLAVAERARRQREITKEEWEAKRKEQAREGYKEATRDNRVQINEVRHLIQQYDTARVHK